VVVQGENLPNTLSERILEFVDRNIDFRPLLNFWANLRENTAFGTRSDLYDFLEKNHVPLTEDGCFVCYKKVNDDYFDVHTGKTHKYTPGSVVKMPRSKVESNRNETCAPGLHVAGHGYMGHFSGQRTIEVKVNPKHVVAVPPDYNFTKIRVCELEVLRDCPRYMSEQVYEEPVDEAEEALVAGDDGDEVVEDTVAATTRTIRRIPAHLSAIVPSADGRVRVSIEVLEKVGIESGQTFFAVVPTKRSTNVVLLTEAPDKAHKMKEISAGTASARLPASLFRHIESDEYRIGCARGTLVIRAN